MQKTIGVTKNMWSRQGNGIYAPNTRNFPINGLVFYAPLWHPELSGSPFISKDLNAHSCTVTGAVWTPQGRTFDGIDDVINCGKADSLNALTGNMTIEAWINPTSLGENNAGRILDKTGGGTRGFTMTVTATQATRFIFYVGTVTKIAISPNNSAPFGSWAHVVGIFNGVNALIYVNKVLTTGTATAGPIDAHSADDLLIGDRADSSYCFNGLTGEARIYNRALSAVEILHSYQATKWRYI